MAVKSGDLVAKSLQAAVAAIEIYNKPDFRYREETFAVLICNAWELLLKAKVLADGKEDFSLIVAYRAEKDPSTGEVHQVAKTNRSGNEMTLGIGVLAARAFEGKVDGVSKEWLANIDLLIELRDNCVHLVSGDVELSQRVLEIGTAAVRNYMSLAVRWFGVDFSRYNFFLMPISFFHGFDAAAGVAASTPSEQTRRFLAFLNAADTSEEEGSPHSVLLRIEAKVVKGKGPDGVAVRWTTDPAAPAMAVREESLLEAYPYDNADLIKKLKERYVDFKQDATYQKYKTPILDDPKYCRRRLYNPKRPKSGSKNFFSSEVFKVFDKHYKKHGDAS